MFLRTTQKKITQEKSENKNERTQAKKKKKTLQHKQMKRLKHEIKTGKNPLEDRVEKIYILEARFTQRRIKQNKTNLVRK